ncbi:hypothetical protein FEM48_ZijujUnG0042500 [Ziziphus jujuba var. spinosa]|uniref:Uncharacterized protein n=1 Tax=Ziziphus jujuba var. spinosa TaxID=714518 RepID=A0A978U9A6_ZIZJJ|nr:hypothetical protein FEM48_ZijujUnG0042500 [Ziziphus jujuba var. spinosa]
MPPCYFAYYNNQMKIAKEIFTETHTDLVKADSEGYQREQRLTSPRTRTGFQSFLNRIADSTGLLGDVAGDVPGHPHFSVPRNGFRKSPTQEAFGRLDLAFSLYYLHVCFFLRWPFCLCSKISLNTWLF